MKTSNPQTPPPSPSRASPLRRAASALADGLGRWRRGASKPAPLNLALQGGGSHGAFTWGVLDRLLEEEDFAVEGTSGASAGAMNAVVLASGYLSGGRRGAQQALREFWQGVSQASRLGPLQPSPLDAWLGGWNLQWSPGYALFRSLARAASPYQLNPTGYNPLLSLLARHVDFERLRRSTLPKLFIAATDVHSGELRVLRNHELSPKALAASACLPLVFHAVELDGSHYWDGGYSANPPLMPLVLECRSHRVLLVRLSPLHHPGVPRQVDEILARSNEFCFNAGLLRELQLLEQVRAQAGLGLGRLARRLRRLALEQIHTDGKLIDYGESSRINAEWTFLRHLHELGWQQADAWLAGREPAAAAADTTAAAPV